MQAHQRLPSLNALRAFEAVARRLSFARAAEELFVTKAAVAQQIRLLEEEIGAPIVERSGRGLRLTEAGAAGAAALTDGFAMLARAARAMREAKGRGFLVVNASASFAATWLVGRIGRFKARHPDIDVLLDADPREDSLERGGADAMVSWGDGAFPGLSTTRLFKEEVFPVCAPKLVAAEPPLTTPSDLARFHAAAPGVEPELSDLAFVERLVEGGGGGRGRGDARRVFQPDVDGDFGGGARAGGGARLARHRRRRSGLRRGSSRRSPRPCARRSAIIFSAGPRRRRRREFGRCAIFWSRRRRFRALEAISSARTCAGSRGNPLGLGWRA